MITIEQAIRRGTAFLESSHVAAPRLTGEVLLSFLLRVDRVYLFAHAADLVSDPLWTEFEHLLVARAAGKPTQYITQRQEFYGREFHVDKSVLIPRPETEHLVEAALHFLRTQGGGRLAILDVGTGSGAVAISIALEHGSPVYASDISADALCTARCNARRYGAPVHFLLADLASSVRPRSLDLLVSNPPYIPAREREQVQREVRDWEPEVALYGGEDGLTHYRQLTVQAARAVRPGGGLMMELGYQSAEPLTAMLQLDWEQVAIHHDLAGLPRVITAIRRRA